jgi:hypothetical protein
MAKCLVDIDYSDECHEIQCKVLTARKQHKCGECGKIVQPREKFEHFTGSDSGEFFHVKTCLVCVEIRDRFCCGWTWGQVLEDIKKAIFWQGADLKLGCLDGLSPEALDVIAGMLDGMEDEEK